MTILQLISVLVAIAALFGWISARWLKLPTTIGTMFLTVACSLSLAGIGEYALGMRPWATHLVRQIDFERLILHGMLPLLLFAGAFLMDIESLIRERITVAILAIFGTVVSVFAVAALMHSILPLIGIQAPWIHCMLFGALISPTDPIAVLEMLRRVGVPHHIEAQLAGESLFNDGVGVVIFVTLLDASHGTVPSVSHVLVMLLLRVGGGLALGILLAWITFFLMRQVDAYQVDVLLTLSLALGGYALSEVWHLSGPLETVAAAIALRWFNMRFPAKLVANERLDDFWKMVDEVQNGVLFVLLGLEVLAIPFQWTLVGSGTTAIVTVIAVRLVVVAVVLGCIRWAGRGRDSSVVLLTWGGLHGGLSLALALALPLADGRTWILATTYIVVVFSIVLQGGSLGMFLRRFKPVETHPPVKQPQEL
ncbi:MAG TPA: sodium:proton antiporter [Acidobacteriaceae bacterium]|nr:sodium:proton antiporter [Acidobacteriaceae bacterium]